ncbi:hypothetical protein ACFO3U_03385 [Flavobacterium ponti]|uniref:Uncharacterized protein n=1 Tax=Flavobacterium ponti TaxID=665133 RepID=A0ABV9P085_9FLAO
MYRRKDTLVNYKKAIKDKFKAEQKGIYASFLLNPSRALLRDLCVQRLKNNPSKEDLKTFSLFFGFEFEVTSLNKLKVQTDKFRPIETFLKGETDLSNKEGINLAAILVDYEPRPYLKFEKSNIEVEPDDLNETEEIKPDKDKIDTTDLIDKPNIGLKKKIGIGVLSVLTLFSVGYTTKEIVFPTKECMQWQKDHYELVDCDIKGLMSFSETIPIDAHQLQLKKIKVDTNTIFFRGNEPVIFYCKVNGELQYFNQLGNHPETGKALKPISHYIINKYIKNIED